MSESSNPCDGETTIKEYYEYLIHQLDRQATLVNSRLTWMLTIEGFLYAGLAVIAGKDTNPQVYKALRIVFPAVGFGISLIGLIGVVSALIALHDLGRGWESKIKGKVISFPKPYGWKGGWGIGWIPSLSLPIVIAVSWVFIARVL